MARSTRLHRSELHWGDQWHYPLSRMAVACRANGLRPIDGPYGDFTDPDGYLAAARRAAVLGYEGKWAIHPSQVPLANEVFTPDERIVERTHRAKLEQIDARAGSRSAGPSRPSKAELEERRAGGGREAGKPDLGAA